MIVVTGAECSGKTTLTRQLARALKLPLVTEAARSYLVSADYRPSDLLHIARLQQAGEAQHQGRRFVADTDLQVLYLWWQEKYGPVPRVLSNAYASQSQRFYLLCRPDLPWVSDPLRENPDDRARLFDLYAADLAARQLPFGVVQGEGEERLRCALKVLTHSGIAQDLRSA